jgi:hypothetical protein
MALILLPIAVATGVGLLVAVVVVARLFGGL